MPQIIGSRSVLAVRDLKRSTDYYTQVLGFEREPIDAEHWSFLRRDDFNLLLGECPDEKSAADIGDHSYMLYLYVDGIDQLHDDVAARGADITAKPTDTPWGLREFSLRTPDGHRIRFGQPIAEP